MYILHRDTPHTDKTYNSSLYRVYTYTQPVSSHMQNRVSFSRQHSLSLSLSLSLTMYTLCIYLFITYRFQSYSESFHVWVWYEYWRMSMARMGCMVKIMFLICWLFSFVNTHLALSCYFSRCEERRRDRGGLGPRNARREKRKELGIRRVPKDLY